MQSGIIFEEGYQMTIGFISISLLLSPIWISLVKRFDEFSISAQGLKSII